MPGEYRPRKSKKGPAPFVWTTLAVAGLIIAFVLSVYLFRRPKPEPPRTTFDTIGDVLSPDAESSLRARRGLDLESKEATLRPVSSRGGEGKATRGEKDENYYLEIETNLTGDSIDRESRIRSLAAKKSAIRFLLSRRNGHRRTRILHSRMGGRGRERLRRLHRSDSHSRAEGWRSRSIITYL